MKIAIVNGPNLNLLGKRESHIYGSQTLIDIKKELEEVADSNGCQLLFFQSNHEGELVDFIQGLLPNEACKGVIIKSSSFYSYFCWH